MLVDSHCHLDFPDLSRRLPSVLQAMQVNGVGAALCVGVTLEDMPSVLAIAAGDDRLYASVGVHPETTEVKEPDVQSLLDIAAHPKIVGIGETGLDYYWHKDRPSWQRERFAIHIHAARQCGKPLIVHMRDATEDTLDLLRAEDARSVGGVMHCFTESWEVAKRALDLGFYISISGIVTFKNAATIKDVARQVPLDRLLLETDAPYLAPAPYRGKSNEPAYVLHVAEAVAALRGLPLEGLAEATTANFYSLFHSAIRP